MFGKRNRNKNDMNKTESTSYDIIKHAFGCSICTKVSINENGEYTCPSKTCDRRVRNEFDLDVLKLLCSTTPTPSHLLGDLINNYRELRCIHDCNKCTFSINNQTGCALNLLYNVIHEQLSMYKEESDLEWQQILERVTK